MLWGTMAAGAKTLRHYFEYTEAADLLDHWLDNSGDAYEVSPKNMLNDLPGFKKLVDKAVDKSEGGTSIPCGSRPRSPTSWRRVAKGPRCRIGSTR